MTTYQENGKDVIIFVTADDHKEPSKVVLPELEPQPGLILPNGEINWNCPCLGGMASGPCGLEFREAFSCFHNSEAEPKGSDCYDAFKEMHLCMAEYPALYNKYDDDKEAEADIDLEDMAGVRDEDSKLLDKKIEEKIKERTEAASKDAKPAEPAAKQTSVKLKEAKRNDEKIEKQNVT